MAKMGMDFAFLFSMEECDLRQGRHIYLYWLTGDDQQQSS